VTATVEPGIEEVERAVSLAVILEERVRKDIAALEDRLTTTAHAVMEADAAVTAGHAKGEDVEPLRRRALELRLTLEGLKRERPGLTALLGQRQAEVHAAERILYTERRKVVAEEADRLVNKVLLPSARKVAATVGVLKGLDEQDRALRFRLHDVGEDALAATPLWGAGLEPSEAWESLQALGRLLDKLEREHPRRRQGMR
jgi:hypothetical protein